MTNEEIKAWFEEALSQIDLKKEMMGMLRDHAREIGFAVAETKEETMDTTQNICNELEKAGYDYAIAVATDAEVEAGAACGQLSIITEE